MFRTLIIGAIGLPRRHPGRSGRSVRRAVRPRRRHTVDQKRHRRRRGCAARLSLGSADERKGPQPYVFAAVNTAGETHYAAAGLAFKFGDKLFIRPGLGIAVHSGSTRDFTRPGSDRIDFGSRILFEPELGVGVRISERATLEASWVHMSHAQLFSAQNPGIDNIGARLQLQAVDRAPTGTA